MEWLDQNLDAYRVLAEILDDLRTEIQKELERVHGPDWFRSGLPTEVFDRLVSSKEGATAIDWYETEYQKIMDFAVFPDFFEILEFNRDHFPVLLELVPSESLLQARFLELEVLRSKVGRARPIGEAELSFLMTFHKRFRKNLERHRKRQAQEKPDTEATEQQATETDGSPPSDGDSPDGNSSFSSTPSRPPQRSATASGGAAIPGAPSTTDPEPEPEPETEENPGGEPQDDEVVVGPLNRLIESGDSTSILRELFKEVTNLAESLWSSDVPPPPTVWNQVRISPWYEENFSTLGLKPLSDFYDVISHVQEKMQSGGLAKHELQKMLEDANFAHVLLSLRDMFQKNRI